MVDSEEFNLFYLMNSRLNGIQDWPKLAKLSQYRAAMLAQRVGVSTRHLDRYCLLHFGCSTKVILRQFQMDSALVIMETRTLTIKEVAYGLGFDHPTHFCRAFKRAFGCSPARYRFQLNQNSNCAPSASVVWA